jgi:hypothetical protein
MMKQRLIHLFLGTALLFSVGLFSVSAQEQTETPVATEETTGTPIPPPNFTDGRISDTAGLGGLAIYCVDKNNNTRVSSFDNGAITVWGVGDQKYINLSAAQLRGNVEVPQEPSVLIAEMTEEAEMSGMETPTAEMTLENTTALSETTTPSMTEPVLLARAMTPNGEIGFFSFGGDRFALQGHDDKGAFFTYTWTGCSTGVLDHTTGTYLSDLEATVEPMMTMEATSDMGSMSGMDTVTPEPTISG